MRYEIFRIFLGQRNTVIGLIVATIVWLNVVQSALISKGQTIYDGTTFDQLPSFYTLNGRNGISAALNNANLNTKLDYFIRLWIRPYNNYHQSNSSQTESLLFFNNSLSCYFTYNSTFICEQNVPTSSLSLNISNMMQRVWVHVSIGGSVSSNISYISIDQQDQPLAVVTGTYVPLVQTIQNWMLFLGSASSNQTGFVGDVRELLVVNAYVPATQIQFLKNQVVSWDTNQLGNYRMIQGNLNEGYRSNLAITLLNKTNSPSWSYDNQANDMCYGFINRSQILRANNIRALQGSIDSRMQTNLADFQYSASFRFKLLPGMQYSSSYQANTAIFSLDGVFALWMSDVQAMRIFIFATLPYYETYTNQIFFPLNQWVNLQFTIDMINGYDIRLYDIQRRLLLQVSQSVYFQNQNPSRTFTVFQNVKGFIRSVMVYQAMKSLPMDDQFGENTAISDSSLIIFYKFHPSNYIDGSFRSLGYSSNVPGPNLYLNDTQVTFEYVEWSDTVNFTNPSNLESISQNLTLYDGLSCNNQNPILAAVSNSSSISYNITVNQSLTEVSVEMWFRRSNTANILSNMTYYLFSLFSTNSNKEYMALTQQNSRLVCSPLDSRNTSNNLSISINNITSTSLAWHHIACKFKSLYKITGVYHTSQNYETFWQFDAENTTLIMQADQYQMTIGNSYNMSMGFLGMRYKEVRLWSRFIEDFEIKQNLFRQIVPDASLLAYFRLSSGLYTAYNYPGLTYSDTQSNTTGFTIVTQEPQLLQCPLNSFPDIMGQVCTRNEFLNQSLAFIPVIIDEKIDHWVLTSNYSDIPFQAMHQNLLYSWSLSNQDLLTSKQETLFFNQAQFDKISIVGIQSVTNNQYTFYSQGQRSFMPYNCTFLVDNNTYEANNFLFYTEEPGSMNLTYFLAEISIGGCDPRNNVTATLSQNLTVQIFPSQLGMNSVFANFDQNSGLFNLSVLASDLQKMTKYQDLHIVITASWNITNDPNNYSFLNGQQGNQTNNNNSTSNTTSLSNNTNSSIQNQTNNSSSQNNSSNSTRRLQSQNTTNQSYWWYTYSHDIVYTIRFVDSITPVLIYYPQQDNLIGEDFFLVADQSYYTSLANQSNSNAGISYQWTCPLILQEFCASRMNSRHLQITYDDFLYSSDPQFNVPYLFTLSVWRSSSYDSNANFTMIVANYWQNIFRANFDFKINNYTQKLLSSQNNVIDLKFPAYNLNDPNLLIQWSIEPPLESQYYQFSRYNSRLTILEQALTPNSSYNITVSASNKTFSQANASSTFIQIIQEPPTNGTVVVYPTNGTSFETIFQVNISNWISTNGDVLYRVYGSFLADQPTQYLIQDTYYVQNNSLQFQSVLPEFQYLTVEITDSSLEKTYYTTSIFVIQNFSLSILDILTAAENLTYPINAQSLKSVRIVLWNIVNEASLSIKTEASYLILSYLYDQTGNYTVMNDTLTDETVRRTQLTVEILRLITDMTDRLNDSHAIATLQILQQARILSQAFAAAMNDQTFQSNYLTLLSNLLQYSQQRLISFNANSNSSRLLQYTTSDLAPQSFTTQNSLSNFIYEVILQKDAFIGQYCNSITLNQTQFTLNSAILELIFEIHPNSSLVWNRTYIREEDQTNVQIPIDQILQGYRQVGVGLFQNFCASVTFFNFNPLLGYPETNIEILDEIVPTISISSIDNNGLNLIDNVQINGGQMSIWTATFNYDFNNSNSNFTNNQTVCMQIQIAQFQDTNLSWSYEGCHTTYDVINKAIICQCNQLGPLFITIGNDYTRLPIIVNTNNNAFSQVFSTIKNFDSFVIPVLIVILICALVFPCLVMRLDSRDYAALKHDSIIVTDDFIRKVAIKKRQPFELVIYSKRRFSRFINAKRLSCCMILKTFILELHPFISLFSRFDIELKRMVRVVFFCYQMYIVASISGLAFGTNYRQNDQNNASRINEGFDNQDKQMAIGAGIVIGLLTLPVSSRITACLKSKLVSEINMNNNSPNTKVDSITRLKNLQKGKSSEKNSPSRVGGVSQDFNGIQDIEEGRAQHTQQRLKSGKRSYMYKEDNTQANLDTSKVEEPVIIIDNCIACKLFLIIISYVFAILSLLVIAIESGANIKANSQCMTVCFFTAFIIGEFGFNFLLLFIEAAVAPLIVKQELNFGQTSGCLKMLDCMFVSNTAKDIIRDMIFVIEIKQQAELVRQEEVEKQKRSQKLKSSQQ